MEYQSSSNMFLEGTHTVLTQRGVVSPSDLKSGDMIIGVAGEAHHISGIIKCGDRPKAEVIGVYDHNTRCLTSVEPDTTKIQVAQKDGFSVGGAG